MSGKDERPRILLELTFPKCPLCTRFKYWIGDRGQGRIFQGSSIFFNSIEHQRNNGFLSVAIYVRGFIKEGRMPTLEELADISYIKCNVCGHRMTAREQDDTIQEVVDYIVRTR